MVDLDFSGPKGGKESFEVHQVLLLPDGSNDDVIEISPGKGQTAQQVIHRSLQRLSNVEEAKRRMGELKKFKCRRDGRLVNVFGGDRQLIENLSQINNREGIATKF